MSSQITEAFVKQFSSNIYMLSQQKGSRLRSAVRVESVKGKSASFDRIGTVTATLRSGRHADTPQIDTPHSRRWVHLADYEHADLIDDADKIRLLIDPASAYSQAFMYAMGRAMDDVVIDAAFAAVTSGEEGSSTVSHPNAQKLVSVASAAGANMNVQALRRAKRELDQSEVDGVQRYFSLTAAQMESLLSQTETTSSDYNSVKALVQGELDTFMGFNFIRSERLDVASITTAFDTTTGAVGSGGGTLSASYRAAMAWGQDGLLLGIGQDMKGRISERSDKSYSTQVFASMSLGACRMEEEKVIQVFSLES